MKMNAEKTNLFYNGRSMRGTFRNGDLLELEPVKPGDLRPGDVVVYRGKDDPEEMVVHRVVLIAKGRIRTRGDWNLQEDSTDLAYSRLIGRVTGLERKGNRHTVANGPRGRNKARFIHTRLQIQRCLQKCLRPLYVLLKKSRIIPRIWDPPLRKVRFQTDGDPIIKYLHRGKTVLSRDSRRLWIKKPYDLLFRVRTGPRGEPVCERIR